MSASAYAPDGTGDSHCSECSLAFMDLPFEAGRASVGDAEGSRADRRLSDLAQERGVLSVLFAEIAARLPVDEAEKRVTSSWLKFVN